MKTLFIQTAFIGDVILLTATLEEFHAHFPHAQIDLLVRKGTESLFAEHPFVSNVYCFDKKAKRFSEISRLLRLIRQQKYGQVINLQRFASTGLLTVLSGAKITVGFKKNPFSRLFTHRYPHLLDGRHEVERNQKLLTPFFEEKERSLVAPKLYPRPQDFEQVRASEQPYVCIAPSSVWFTKQLPAQKWIELIQELVHKFKVYLLGAPADHAYCEAIRAATTPEVQNLAGQLGLLASAALMKNAQMNYVNDSAPLHLASAVDAPVTAVFCSTIPKFGFTPLSTKTFIRESSENLACRPCGLHGHKQCPEGHFRCADISIPSLVETSG